MEKNITKKKNAYNKWLLIGLLSIPLAAPNGTFIKSALSEIDSTTFAFLKFAMMLVVFLPLAALFAVKNREILKKNAASLLISAAANVVSMLVFYKAIELSTASYASIIALLSPIILVIMSKRLIKEKVDSRAVAGITLAAIGGLLVVALPAIIGNSAMSVFYPLATILVLINCIVFPISVIYNRKSSEGGVPFSVYSGVSAVMVVGAILVSSIFTGSVDSMIDRTINMSVWGWLAIVYSCFAVSFLARKLWIKSYEHVGSAVAGGLSYAESLSGIVIPLIVLGEKLSVEMMAGALLILLGVYLAQSRPGKDAADGNPKPSLHIAHRHTHGH